MISLYRGELYKVSGITRQWPLPKPTFTLSAFRQAVEKRNDAVRRSSLSVLGSPTPYLTCQDTCISGSHYVSPGHLRSWEDPETEIGREGRGESDGHIKADYMKEGVHLDAGDVEDRSKVGGETRRMHCRSFIEEYRDGSAPLEDLTGRVLVRGQLSDDSEPELEPADLEYHFLDKKERKKRKREEVTLVKTNKGKLTDKEDFAPFGGVDRMEVDGAREDMALDRTVGNVEVSAEAVGNNFKRPDVDMDNGEKELSDAVPDVAMSVDEGEGNVGHEQLYFVNLEARSTPPVHSEKLDFGKPMEGKDDVEVFRAIDPAGDKVVMKAEWEAKLKVLTAEKHHLVQMLKQILTTEKESKKIVQSSSMSPSALGALSAPGASSASQSTPNSTDTGGGGGAEVALKVNVLNATNHQVRSNRFGCQPNSSRRVQVLSTEEESKKKAQGFSQSPPDPGTQSTSQAGLTSTDNLTAAPDTVSAGAVEVQLSADLEEGELEYARTPSPPSHTTSTSHSVSHGQHSYGSTPALGPLLGRLPQHLNQCGSARGKYYQQGKSLPSPSSAAAAAALAGAISPGTAFMPLVLGVRPYQQHMVLNSAYVMQHAAAVHAQKVAVAVAAAAAGHSHMSPMLGGGPAGAGNGVNNGPPGFGGYGASSTVHGHHCHMSQGTSPGPGHVPSQQGVVSPSLLTTQRGTPGYHDIRLNPPWNLQR